MTYKGSPYDAVHWHMYEITSRIIAESGNPSDRYHLGKIILQSLKDDPELVAQIDGATGESETNGSVLRRSIQCAIGFRRLGLRLGDVIILMAPNHLDLTVPLYAAYFEGIIVAPMDKELGIGELKNAFEVNKPKVIFCQSEKAENIQKALKEAQLEAKVISFDERTHGETFTELLKLGNDGKEIQNYRAADIDPAETLAMLIPTSGTTGLPKSSAVTHMNFVITGPYMWTRTTEIPYIKSTLMASPLQWLSAVLMYNSSAYMKFTRIQTSLPSTPEHLLHLINTYKPEFFIVSPTMMTSVLKARKQENCDFTCFKDIFIGGSAVYPELISQVQLLTSPETGVIAIYGLSELTTMAFAHGLSSPLHSCGKPNGLYQYRLVDPETGKDIDEPNKNGELWLNGPGIFKGYYNNPEATAEVFSEDGWFKTGDLMYRDESWNFFFVERIKLLLKYKNHQISPVEVEKVIIQHPGVQDVAVTGIPDQEFGDLAVACVVRRKGYDVTAQEIKDLVAESLTDSKHLRGGVVFMDELPITPSTKLHRRKIKEMVLIMERE